MRIFAVLLLSLVACSSLYAEVFIGTEKEVSVKSLKAILEGLGFAAQRPNEEQNTHVYIQIQDAIWLTCPPHLPDKDGNGCYMFFTPKSAPVKGDFSLSLKKPVERELLSSTVTQAKQKTEGTDPNVTEDHLQFGNPLYKLPPGQSDGTHYYCAPESENGKKAWKCYLSVSEALGKIPN